MLRISKEQVKESLVSLDAAIGGSRALAEPAWLAWRRGGMRKMQSALWRGVAKYAADCDIRRCVVSAEDYVRTLGRELGLFMPCWGLQGVNWHRHIRRLVFANQGAANSDMQACCPTRGCVLDPRLPRATTIDSCLG